MHCVFVYMCICVFVNLCICEYVNLCICVFVYLGICVFVLLVHDEMMRTSVKTESCHALGGAGRQDMTLHPIPGISYVRCRINRTAYIKGDINRGYMCQTHYSFLVYDLRCHVYFSCGLTN